MHPNGTPHTTDPPVRDDAAVGDIFLDLNEEGRAALADLKWIDEQYNLGAFEAYRGEWIAVVGKKVLGHGGEVKKLREDVMRETGFPNSRIATEYIAADSDLDMFPE